MYLSGYYQDTGEAVQNFREIGAVLIRKEDITMGKRMVLVWVTSEADPKTMCSLFKR